MSVVILVHFIGARCGPTPSCVVFPSPDSMKHYLGLQIVVSKLTSLPAYQELPQRFYANHVGSLPRPLRHPRRSVIVGRRRFLRITFREPTNARYGTERRKHGADQCILVRVLLPRTSKPNFIHLIRRSAISSDMIRSESHQGYVCNPWRTVLVLLSRTSLC
ncbi:hypothetical protein SCLCIDRAFT_1138667 [Scleroderma citrinum Foug A]|uniref:Uncharacterized protein n=1 Tax=Scleroderma citrinum Foug A TaxID=1036808 RepID=A0A0C3DM23_9AGAM|nr:hypothetical protein SCLCIDRAFT_1138667 [Scleroderma citrinum Foug A]